MRSAALVIVLPLLIALPTQAVNSARSVPDLANFAIAGVKLGDTLTIVKDKLPKGRISHFRDPKIKHVVTGGRVDAQIKTEEGTASIVVHLTHDDRVYKIELQERLPEELLGYPIDLISRLMDRYGPPTAFYGLESESGKTYLTWRDLPRRQRFMSIRLLYTREGECAALKPKNVDCAKHRWVYSNVTIRYILKDRELEEAHRRTVQRILRREKASGN